MNIFCEDFNNEIFLVNSTNVYKDYVPAGTPVIKIQPGDEYLFNRETIQNMVGTINPDILDKFDVSIRKVGSNSWMVRFGKLSSDWEEIKLSE